MSDTVHRYYCKVCNLALFGQTLAILAANLNGHLNKMHPMDYCGWTAIDIVKSDNYSGPSSPPEYLQSHVSPEKKAWGGAKPPAVSERDKIFLEKNGIRWD